MLYALLPCSLIAKPYAFKGGGGGLTLYEIYIGFCPRTDFYNIMHIACLVHDHFISNIDFLLTT